MGHEYFGYSTCENLGKNSGIVAKIKEFVPEYIGGNGVKTN
jgi:hypothetical protein